MKPRFLMLAGWLLLGLLVARAFPAQAEPGVLRLGDALRAAAENFDVAVARSGLDAARADVLAADHDPLPMLTAKASQLDFQHGLGAGNWFADKRIDKSLGVDWTWERGNKRALRTAAAQAAAAAARGDLQDVRRQQLGLAWGAYFDLLAAQQRVTEVQQLFQGADGLLAAMRARHKVGDVSAQDLARTEIETTRARLDLQSARAARDQAGNALARLIGRSQPDLMADESAWPVDDASLAAPLAESQVVALIADSPDVQAAQARVQAAQAVLDGTIAARKSDVTWGVSVDHWPGVSTRQLELRLQVPLQLGYEQQGEIGRARAQLQQAVELEAKTRGLAQAELSRVGLALRATGMVLAAQEREVLPKARQVLTQAELAYQKGGIPLTDLIEARRGLRAALLDALAARAEHARASGAWRLLTRPDLIEHL